jgi:uncharacterized protein YbjT (DUF2867 family)
MTILVTGATGNVGRAVVRELVARGVGVRAFVRDAVELPAGVEAAIGDLDDPVSIEEALDGVDRVFLSSGDSLQKVRQEATVVDRAANVELLVKASTIGPARDRRCRRSTGTAAARSTSADPASRTSSWSPAST